MFFLFITHHKIILRHRKTQTKNKKSAESGVAPVGIKSHKFLFELKKICFAVFKRLMG